MHSDSRASLSQVAHDASKESAAGELSEGALTPYGICCALAVKRGFQANRSDAPDAHRAGLAILQESSALERVLITWLGSMGSYIIAATPHDATVWVVDLLLRLGYSTSATHPRVLTNNRISAAGCRRRRREPVRVACGARSAQLIRRDDRTRDTLHAGRA